MTPEFLSGLDKCCFFSWIYDYRIWTSIVGENEFIFKDVEFEAPGNLENYIWSLELRQDL